MIPGGVDPRRPEKVQRYKPNSGGTGSNAAGEDLTPDYMNILGPDSTRGNVQGDVGLNEAPISAEAKSQPSTVLESLLQSQEITGSNINKPEPPTITAIVNNTLNNVIPTSPQYGVAIIPTAITTTGNDISIEPITSSINTLTESVSKTNLEGGENKEMHSTPSKNDRFKVVKIASSEPYRRGRWKCMDFVDQPPAFPTQQVKSTTQQQPTIVPAANEIYKQLQSLQPQQIQHMLLQSAFYVPPHYIQGNLQSQLMPQQQQYFFQAAPVPNPNSAPQQITINPSTTVVQAAQPQFVNPPQQQQQAQTQQQQQKQPQPTQQYFQALVQPNFQNLQFVQPAAFQASAFVPTSQNIQNFQQAQTYAGQATVTQQQQTSQPTVQNQTQSVPPASQSQSQAQSMVNGYTYLTQSNVQEQQQQPQQQITAASLPNQVAKNVIMGSSNQPQQQQQVQQTQQQQPQQQTQPVVHQNQQQQQQPESQTSIATVSQQQQQQPTQQPPPSAATAIVTTCPPPQVQTQIIPNPLANVVVLQSFDPNHQPNDVYANPQFVASVHSLPLIESKDVVKVPDGTTMDVVISNGTIDNPEDLSKANPVANAIDNKIEQAMDLVKSHLMYTVREEVEVLKEKIAELMERIQQLESENNFLRSQLPKSNPNSTSGNGGGNGGSGNNSEPSPQQ